MQMKYKTLFAIIVVFLFTDLLYSQDSLEVVPRITDEDIELIILGISELTNPKRIRNSVNLNKNYLGNLYCRKWNGKSIFQPFSTSDYRTVEEDKIREYVQIKTSKQKKWRDSFQLKWLVIHTGFNNCNTLDINYLKGDFTEFKTNWDRILLFNPFEKKLLDII